MANATRPCRVCGVRKPENGVGDRPIRCRDCFNAARRDRRHENAPYIDCAYCGEPFKRLKGTQKLCSAECVRQWGRVRRGVEPLQERQCAECGAAFDPARMNSTTCSNLCAGRAKQKRRAGNPVYAEYRKAYAKRYHAENREALVAKSRAWREANREHHRELSREWSRANRHRYSWRRDNPGKHAANQRVRYARLRSLTPEPIPHAKVMDKVAYWGFACWICGAPYEAVDHVKPIAKGGLNVVANMRPICNPCNSRKRAKWFGVANLELLRA